MQYGDCVKSKPLLLLNIRQLLTMRSVASGRRRGTALSDLGIVESAAVLCLAGKIVSVGTTKDALRDPGLKTHRKKIIELDCRGRVALPAFSDSHHHPPFTHPRPHHSKNRLARPPT